MQYVVAISSSSLPKLYVFESPVGHIEPGERVLVPYRKRKTIGYVVSELERFRTAFPDLLDFLDFPESERSIAERLDYCTYLEEWRISALLRTALRHAGGFGRYFDLCFPPRFDDYFSLFVESASPLLDIKKMPYSDFKKVQKFQDYLRNGLVRIFRDFSERRPRPRESMYATLAMNSNQLSQTRLTERQRRVVNYLLLSGQALVDELVEETGVSRDVVVQLKNKGVVVLSAEPVKMPEEASNPGDTVKLSDEQFKASQEIVRNDGPSLLYGPTGSGKTEVYLEVIEKYLNEGSVLYLLPEVSLTEQVVSRVRRRFPDASLAVYHSYLTEAKRVEVWSRAVRGDVDILIGARSALFVPVKNLRLVVVDEEHDDSYVSDIEPHYSVHAVLEFFPVKVVYGSATPSLRSFFKATALGTLSFHVLTRRYGSEMPNVTIVDMRSEARVSPSISKTLLESLEKTLSEGHAALVYTRRKGFSRVQCAQCGHIVSCEHCDISLTFHREKNLLKCHMCGFLTVPPAVCPLCGSKMFVDVGTGTEKVESELRGLFPARSIGRLDAEVIENPKEIWEILGKLRDGYLDVLVGTKMITKGLDIFRIKLVGVVDIDALLSYPDPNAPLKTFQLLVQVVGRSGRREKGEAVLQTFNPDHPVIRHACSGTVSEYYEHELSLRRELNYPPYAELVELTYSNADAQIALETVETFAKELAEMFSGSSSLIELLGPVEHPVFKHKDKFRYQLFLKTRTPEKLTKHMSELFVRYPGEWAVRLRVV